MSNQKIQKIPSKPEESLNTNVNEVLVRMENGEQFAQEDIDAIDGACTYIDGRYDCADFYAISLIRLLYDYDNQLSNEAVNRIKQSLLGFKFFMDQPNSDSMCLWSENHQLLFATIEYLTGQLYPNEIFSNDGKTGQEHMAIAQERLFIWFVQRWNYGFTEWYSNTYYVEDIAPLSNLIDFAKSEEVKVKATIMMDLLLYDLATQSYKGSFVSTSGRMYESGKKAGENNSMRAVTESIWDYEVGNDRLGMDINFLLVNDYNVPEVIKNIGYDHRNVMIKASSGLNLSEYKNEQLIGNNLDRVMMQWASEAFTNPEVIHDTMNYIHHNNMLYNEFLNDFKQIDLTLLRKTHLLPIMSRLLNLVTNGIAIQRANTYTYRTEDYMLATAQAYHPGEFGDQHHIWTATIDSEISIFTTHPAKPLSDEGALSNSPSYWVGNGRQPHSVQDEKINITMYVVDGKKGFMEKSLVYSSHAYFPMNKFDEVVLENNRIFARKGSVFVSMTGKNNLNYVDDQCEDLVQQGAITYWITELSTISQETFEHFMNRINGNTVAFDDRNLALNYCSNEKDLEITYQGDFYVNGRRQNLEYKRFDSPYSQTERKAEMIKIEYQDDALVLDFENLERKIVNDLGE